MKAVAHQQVSTEVREIVADIKRYLRGHVGAADTLEGVARWWVVRSRVDALMPRVSLALEQLVDEGLLNRRRLPDGTFIYASTVSGQAERETGSRNDNQ